MISEILVAPQPVAWLPWAVQYFFYIGSAYGAALLLWLALRRRDSYSVTFIRAMALVLLISCVVGPLALTADLHQPGRAWHFFAYLTPGSWMSRGALLLPLFSLLGVVTGWLCLRPALQEAARTRWSPLLILLAAGRWSAAPALVRLCALLTVLSGASIALYTGSEVGIVAARPLWHQWVLPWLWLCSAPLASVGLWALVRGLLDQPVTATDRRLLRGDLQRRAGEPAVAGLLAILAHGAGRGGGAFVYACTGVARRAVAAADARGVAVAGAAALAGRPVGHRRGGLAALADPDRRTAGPPL
ncbi:NrfD/PsrC family molybdoenzyme membrane anchor subunit [Edwardsiella piscicida]|uniref:NrfD/PsrC family molybdoenzyme membrane anchor subunit n=1 Tax=Edwardsiella piscicida TaxID=1263550 RepID=UPI00370D70C1